MKQMQFLSASLTPIKDLELITPIGQSPERRMYQGGYEVFFNQIPVITGDESIDDFEQPTMIAKYQMQHLARILRKEDWVKDNQLEINGFSRTILAMESPTKECLGIGAVPNYKEGREILVAKWGQNHTSPVHGHKSGYIHEELLYGKIRINTYEIVDAEHRIVHLVETRIVSEPGTIISQFMKRDGRRTNLIHNFVALEPSATLHYLSEHTRDGRDNTFNVEFFEDLYPVTSDDFERITGAEGMYLQIGDVVMVRSMNVPDYGDHYIVVTGHPIMKDHGMRVQDTAIAISPKNKILDEFQMKNGLTLLKMKFAMKEKFFNFHEGLAEQVYIIKERQLIFD